MRYKYCPMCAAKLILKNAGDEGAVPYCQQCKRFWFDTFSSCSIVLVANEENEIAVLRQGYLSDKYGTFVSGYITPGETAEQTAYREVKEEIGITLDSLEYAGTYWFGKREILMHGFIGYAKKADFRLSQEVDSVKWVKAEKAGDIIFPDSPENAAFKIYSKYMKKHK